MIKIDVKIHRVVFDSIIYSIPDIGEYGSYFFQQTNKK